MYTSKIYRICPAADNAFLSSKRGKILASPSCSKCASPDISSDLCYLDITSRAARAERRYWTPRGAPTMSQNGQPVPNLAQILAALNASQPQPQPQSQQQQDADHSPSLPPDNPYQGQTSSFPTSSNDPQQYGYGYTGYDANPVPPQPSVPFPNHSYPSLSSGIPALPQQQWQPHPSISSLPSLHYPNTHNHVPSQPQPQRTTTPPERPPSTAARPASTSIEAVAKPQQDPATITTWSAAVRHVTRLAARREELGERVERMLRTAQEHEGQW